MNWLRGIMVTASILLVAILTNAMMAGLLLLFGPASIGIVLALATVFCVVVFSCRGE
jgi:hypothetical protein